MKERQMLPQSGMCINDGRDPPRSHTLITYWKLQCSSLKLQAVPTRIL